VAWPLAAQAQAQQPAMPVIGFLSNSEEEVRSSLEAMLRAGLADGGFIEGRNLSIEYRWAVNFRQLGGMAADLVRLQAAVIVTYYLTPARAAMAATSTVPIVFAYGGDPVKDGLVASLSRPGGNVTGMMTFATELDGKRLDLLSKMVPRVRKVGFLSGVRSHFGYDELTTTMLAAGRALGVEIMIVECRDDRDFEAAVAKMVEGGAGAMILSSFVFDKLEKVVSLALLHKLPAVYPSAGLAHAGGLMSYDTDTNALFRRLGDAYVARILKGEKPANLPIEQPTKFKLTINLKTAKTLGLTVPPTLFALADEVIE
jgi:putative ABC transport system substrate-binding protein